MPTHGNEITEPSQREVGHGGRRLGLFAVYWIPQGRDEHDRQRGGNWAAIIESLANRPSPIVGTRLLTSVIIRMPAHSLLNLDLSTIIQ